MPVIRFPISRAIREEAALFVEKSLNLSKKLHITLRDGDREGIEASIPLIHSVSNELGLIDGNKQHIVGVDTKEGRIEVKSKDPEIYTRRPRIFGRKTEPEELSLSQESVTSFYQGIIDAAYDEVEGHLGEIWGETENGSDLVITEKEVNSTLEFLNKEGEIVFHPKRKNKEGSLTFHRVEKPHSSSPEGLG